MSLANVAQEILRFWFGEIEPEQWWTVDPSLDRLITERFCDVHARAVQCELFQWRTTPEGRLAEVIVLDQFSRNMFRDSAAAFAADPLALALAQEAVASGADRELDVAHRSFLYLPYMHSESVVIHDLAVSLYRELGDPDKCEFERRHRETIERFGRYPHRNKVLGRASTAAERLSQGLGFWVLAEDYHAEISRVWRD